MGSGSAYNYIAMKEAVKDSGLEEKDVSNISTGIVMGSGGPSIENVILAADKTRAKTPKLMGPFIVPRTMASTASATLAVPFKIKGVNYTMSSACATTCLRVAPPLDLSQYFDLNSQAGQQRAWALLTKQCPRVALLSPDDKGCIPGRTSAPQGQPQSDFCAQVASHQGVHGRYVLIMAQSDSTMWARNVVLALSKAHGVTELAPNLLFVVTHTQNGHHHAHVASCCSFTVDAWLLPSKEAAEEHASGISGPMLPHSVTATVPIPFVLVVIRLVPIC